MHSGICIYFCGIDVNFRILRETLGLGSLLHYGRGGGRIIMQIAIDSKFVEECSVSIMQGGLECGFT